MAPLVRHVASDLRATLTRAGETTPFVLVGHSIGGVYAMKFTERYSADVAGLVFVDASHPDQVARLEAASGASMLPPTGPASLGASLSRTGALGLLPANTEPANAPRVVQRVSSAYLPVSLPAMVEEVKSVREIFSSTRAFRALDSRPVVVLTAGAPSSTETLKAMSMRRVSACRPSGSCCKTNRSAGRQTAGMKRSPTRRATSSSTVQMPSFERCATWSAPFGNRIPCPSRRFDLDRVK